MLAQPHMKTSPTPARDLAERIERESAWVGELDAALHEVLVGQEELLHGLLVALLTNGHVLLEGLPGLAKTLAVSSLAGAVHGSFARIQFTPDLLPSDLVGTEIYNVKEGNFQVRRGPVFANFVLADEINRAPPKVQSALLEAMQERQVTIGDETYRLEEPFLVLATQNPIEHEGTYPLPEAQVDRFMLKLKIDYPSRDEERAILDRMTGGELQPVRKVASPADLKRASALVRQIYVDDRVKDYIVSLVVATRRPADHGLADLAPLIQYGASPRATIYLTEAAKAHAFLRGRGFVTPEDVKSIGADVLRHRILLTYEAEAEDVLPDTIVKRLFDTVEVP